MELKKASKIIEAFGPCTVLYECKTPAEVVTMAADEYLTATDLASIYLTVEDVDRERGGHDIYTEWVAAKPALLERLAAIDIHLK